MTRDVLTAALVLNAIAGTDPADPGTKDADAHRTNYVAALRPDALKGVRIGVMRFAAGFSIETDKVFEVALAVLRAQGATLIEIREHKADGMGGRRIHRPLHRAQDGSRRLPRHHEGARPHARRRDRVRHRTCAPGDAAVRAGHVRESGSDEGPDRPRLHRRAREIAGACGRAGHRRHARRGEGGRARRADDGAGLPDRRGERRRVRRRRRGQLRRDRGLSPPHRADGRGPRAARRPVPSSARSGATRRSSASVSPTNRRATRGSSPPSRDRWKRATRSPRRSRQRSRRASNLVTPALRGPASAPTLKGSGTQDQVRGDGKNGLTPPSASSSPAPAAPPRFPAPPNRASRRHRHTRRRARAGSSSIRSFRLRAHS